MIPFKPEYEEAYLDMLREMTGRDQNEHLVVEISERIDRSLRRDKGPYIETTLALWLSIMNRINLRLSVISKKEMEDLQRTARESGDTKEIEAASRLHGLWEFVQNTLV